VLRRWWSGARSDERYLMAARVFLLNLPWLPYRAERDIPRGFTGRRRHLAASSADVPERTAKSLFLNQMARASNDAAKIGPQSRFALQGHSLRSVVVLRAKVGGDSQSIGAARSPETRIKTDSKSNEIETLPRKFH